MHPRHSISSLEGISTSFASGISFQIFLNSLLVKLALPISLNNSFVLQSGHDPSEH